MPKYYPEKIEKKWQKYWEAKKLYAAKDKAEGENYMLLAEFPYTSGNLHMGHWFTYSIADIYARYLRMNGHNVMYPIGFDAFGLPAENAAIKHGTSPGKWTKQNISNMKKQLKSIGTTFDWPRVVDTSAPDYYKWTQWVFLKLYEKGLAYRGETTVNWCPKDKTVLANEQVVNGCCDRCDTPVEQRKLTQWMFRITNFADVLIDDIEGLDWPEDTKAAQTNWIGRSEGALIKFLVPNSKEYVEVFTTRADTLFGATYMVLAPEHPMLMKLTADANLNKVNQYLEEVKKKTELERMHADKTKTGVFTGGYVVNPINNERIPVWVADYVLGWYGTGAVMAVPAHDERDYEFAKKFGLPIKTVIEPETGEAVPDEQHRKSIVAIVEDPKNKKYLTLNWGPKLGGTLFIGGGREEGEDEVATALREIKEETGYTNVKFIAKTELMHHHYYAFSKKVARNIEVMGLYFILENNEQAEKNLQHDEKDNFEIEWLGKDEIFSKMEDENHLLCFKRLVLDEAYTGKGLLANSGEFNGTPSGEAKKKIVGKLKEKSLADFKKIYRLHDWILSRQRYWGAPIPMLRCPKCGYQPVPQEALPVELPELTDFLPVEGGKSPLARAENWVKVKCPKCGGPAERETDTMDTFVDSSWYFMRYTDPKNKKELAAKDKIKKWLPVPLYIGGREHNTMHLLYARFITKALNSLGVIDFNEPFLSRRNHGVIMGPDGKRMSKSRGNVVDPDAEVKSYGADVVRMNFAFLGPFEQDFAWNPNSLSGISRFLYRVWNFVERYDKKNKKAGTEAELPINKAVKEIGEDIKNQRFNTGVSGLMKLLNEIEDKSLSRSQYETFTKLLAPFAPHLAEEVWQEVLGNKKSVHLEAWPKYDEALLAEELITLVLQVNGKLRDSVKVKRGLSEEEARSISLSNENVKKYLAGNEPKKFVYVKDKLTNVVI